MIKVLFFAQLREQLGCSELSVSVCDAASVTQLQEFLVKQYPHWADFLQSEKVLMAVNHVVVKKSQGLVPGEEVAFFPPVTGG